MNMNMRIRLALLAMFLTLGTPGLRAQEFEGQRLVRASLVSSVTAITPGRPFQVGILLEMAPGWHTYWEYPGDAGLATKLVWTLPEGFVAGPIEWPVPEAKVEPGDIQTYGYGNRVLLLTTIVPPRELSGEVTLAAKASWLVCKEICIPGSEALSLTLPTGGPSAPANTELFDAFRPLVPSQEPPPFRIEWSRNGNEVTLRAAGLPGEETISFFPLPGDGQEVGHPTSPAPNEVRLSTGGPLRGVVAVDSGSVRRAWLVAEPSGSVAAAPSEKAPAMGLWTALFYGFLGGLILNLMPCVLPVISLKIFGFIRQAGDSRGRILAHGLAFMAGIYAWFLGLGLLVVALKSGGAEVTWAFQFQNPWFNIAIGTLVFAFALNLFGVFELVLPGRASTAMETAGSSGGLGGAFFQGVFATLLATPCTAPFLGTALGFAFSQPAGVILAMFGSVATGMALPYLLLSAQPGWMAFLPKPGAWMERFKQLMGFPLAATLVWVLSILGGQKGVEGIVWFGAFLVCVAFAAWLYGSFCGPLASARARTIALLLVVLSLSGGGWFFLGERFVRAGEKASDGIAWVPFSEAKLKELQGEGRAVFLDFTADWCITCKFNERTAIDTPAIRALLREKNVVPMKADWTNANPEITAALKAFGRVGVPFYVIYPPGRADEPIVLPELLTEGILADALKKLP